MGKSIDRKKVYANFGLASQEVEKLNEYLRREDLKLTQLVRKLIRAHVLGTPEKV